MKKFAALILFAIIIFVMFACANPGSKENYNTANSETDQTEETTKETTERYIPDLPDIDFGGYEFRAFVPISNIHGNYAFSTGEETGDIINDAIYTRNRYIEAKYNVFLKQTEIEDMWQLSDIFKKSVTSGSDDFDLCVQIGRYGYSLAVEGYAMRAEELPYLDMTKPWYAYDINETMSVGNIHFIVYSDECLNLYEGLQALCFNKNLINDLGLEVPYDLVYNETWTYDKFFDMCKAATHDVDGDGSMTDNDRYGVLSQIDMFISNFWVCAGIKTVVKDSDNMLVLNTVGNERLINVLEKTRQNLYGGEKIYFDAYVDIKGNTDREVSHQQFENNRGLFYSAQMAMVPYMRGMETDFGIVPFPKENENQSRYYTRVIDAWPKIVPNNAPDPERTSIILEAVAAESKSTTVPAYKEISLRTKFTRDNESSEMIDIIFNNAVMDLGDIMWLEIRSPFIYEASGNGNFVSVAEKNAKSFQRLLDKVNNAAADLS